MDDAILRRDLVAEIRAMNALGIDQGIFGKISARHPYDDMQPGGLAETLRGFAGYGVRDPG